MPKCLNFMWNHKIPESARDFLVRPQACQARVSTLFQNVSMSISMTTFQRCVDKRKLLSICFYEVFFRRLTLVGKSRARNKKTNLSCHDITSVFTELSIDFSSRPIIAREIALLSKKGDSSSKK